MHRPTRQHQNLAAKLELKSDNRRVGKKARRYKKALETYEALTEQGRAETLAAAAEAADGADDAS